MRHFPAFLILLLTLTGYTSDPLAKAAAVTVPCDMIALNRAYAEQVYQHRLKAYGHGVVVRFDRNMMYHTFAHNVVMQTSDSLYHGFTFNSEMVGAYLNLDDHNNPEKLAAYIFRQFDASTTGHHETQMDITNTYISVTCTSKYFVVRMNSRPDGLAKPVAMVIK